MRDDDILSPVPSQKVINHSPGGFNWGLYETPSNGQFSYEFCGDSDDTIIGSWNFMEIKDVRVEYANMDNVERHLQNPSEFYLLWNISLEFDGSIHQYSFAIKSSDKINKELVAMSRHISNLGEPLSRQMSISCDDFGKTSSLFRILTLMPIARCSPNFPLETEPLRLNPKVFILMPPIVTVLRAENILERASCFAIDGIRKSLGNLPSTLTTNIFWHMILVSFYLYYIISIPNKTSEGALQLALALLLDATGNEQIARCHYQNFKWEYITAWKDNWEITSQEITDWLKGVPI